MKRNNYDDDEMVALIAEGRLGYKEIGERLGVAATMVSKIANGRGRPDLQGRINAAVQENNRRVRRRAGTALAGLEGPAPRPDPRRKKQYDDDLLVKLIAAGKLGYVEIAERVGIGRHIVSDVANGRRRGDLQPRINAAVRERLEAARKAGMRNPGGQTEHPPARARPCYRNKEYDDDLLVELIASGQMPATRIARHVGISPTQVRRITRGLGRPELQARIHAAVRANEAEAHRLAARWLKGLLAQHIRDGIEGEGPEARKCREFVMTFIVMYGHFDDPPPPAPEPVRGLSDLSPGLQKQVLEELGGPCEEWMFIDHTVEGHEDAAPLWPNSGSQVLGLPAGEAGPRS